MWLAKLWRRVTFVSAHEGSAAIGGDNINSPITVNQRDPQDKAIIDSLLAHNQLLAAENSELREQIEPAVVGLSNLDESKQEIEGTRAALAKGDTEKARALISTSCATNS